jgi:cytidyltransferase-like protein
MNIGQEIVQELLEQSTPIVALYPGKFKPPHQGHFNVVNKASEIADEVIVIMSNVPKDEFTPEQSMEVWSLYKDLLPSNVEIKVATKSSPVSEVFDIIKDKSRDFIVLYGKGERSRYAAIDKDREKYSNVQIVDAGTTENFNATDLRTAIRNKDLEDIQTFLPKGIDAKQIFSIYSKDEFKPGPILHENFTPQKAPLIDKFVDYTCDKLNVDKPKVFVINSPTYSQEHKSFGGYYPQEQEIKIVVHNRNMADILRTLAHELVHHMQNLNGNELNGEDGSDTENEANAMAGVIMREFGRENPEIFESQTTEEIDEYDVENEQDLKEFISFLKEYTKQLSESTLTEAEYQGRKVTLGKIMQGDIKKFKVYVKNNKGKVVKVNFGFGGKSAKGKRMVIKAKNPKRRAAYRARHNCANPGPRWKANYWSCKKW